jgi:tetratricopeptide (TPR) repeat protein
MSRFHLILVFVCASFGISAQSRLAQYLKAAEDKYRNGDYYYSVELYEMAMELDSNSIETLWNYAEALRAFKDYRKAEYYFEKVYDREEAMIYPMSIINLGLMQKCNGKYEEALETFKKAKKKFAKNRKEYPYLKAKREMESCLWAKSAVKDTANLIFSRLPETVNTPNSEFGHSISEGTFIFSSLRADSIGSGEEVYTKSYKTCLYKSAIDSGSLSQSQRIDDLFFNGFSTGNGTFSLDGQRFYFSLCTDEGYNYSCKIMVSRYENGKWSAADSLGDIINVTGSNTSMPAIGMMDGQEVLFYSSNREGGEGGMDIWFSAIKNGNEYAKPRAIKTINSLDNELSPWWDQRTSTLYFSSSWHDGFGGYDVYAVPYNTQFGEPKNAGIPINSPANDLYYFKSGDTSYFSSNRLGVIYSKNPTCCSDVFSAAPPVIITPPTPKETLEDLNKRLPVTLYFHNDCPDPKTLDTITKVNYITSYDDYRKLLPEYQKEYSNGLSGVKAEDAREDIESFFIEYVDQGVKDLNLFRDLLLEELKKGARIKVTVQGFASPLHKTAYNVNLTKRRISSFMNYLRAFGNGEFVPYLDGTAENGGYVIFVQVPFGEYTANQLTSDNINDQRNSVYSRAAAIERKIEIQSVESIQEDSLAFYTELSPTSMDFGSIVRGATFAKNIVFKNKSNQPLNVERIDFDATIIDVKIANEIASHSETSIQFTNVGQLPKGLFSTPVRIYFKGYASPITISVLGEGL